MPLPSSPRGELRQLSVPAVIARPAATAMAEDPAEGQDKEQRQEEEMTAADQEEQSGQQQPEDGKAHQQPYG